MHNEIKMKISAFPKMLASLKHSNQFLKMFSVSLLAICFLMLILIFMLVTKEPLVLAFNSNGKVLSKSDLPKAEDQIHQAIHAYLDIRYNWNPSDVSKKLNQSETFIASNSLKVFKAAMVNIARFSQEKQVDQKIFPENIKIFLDKKTAYIFGDRLTSIQGIKAAGTLKLYLDFDFGPRTKENPWGVYITKEREEQI